MLDRLPEELLEHILSFYSSAPLHSQDSAGNRNNQETLATISRVNKTFCRIARPYLYRVCDIDNLDFLLTTLAVTRPSNALLIRELRVRHQRRPGEPGTQYESTVLAHDDTCERTLMNICAGSDSLSSLRIGLANGFVQYSEQVKVAMLITACLELQVLVLDTELWGRSNLIPRLLDTLASHQGQKLSDLSITLEFNGQSPDYESEGSNDEDADFVDFTWQMPFLETFRGFGVVMVERLYSFDPISAPALRNLYLRESMLDEAGILQILLQYPLLEQLKIHYGDMPAMEQFSTNYSLIGDHLRTHGLRLRTLEMDIRAAMYNEFHHFDSWTGVLGSLAGLPQLETLRLPLQLLLDDLEDDPDLLDTSFTLKLPISLQHLELLCWPDTIPPLEGLQGE